MKTICKDCQGTGKLGFQREDCWFCGGSGYIDDLVHRPINPNLSVIEPINLDIYSIESTKDVRNIRYEGDLDKYFKEVKECDISNDIICVLADLYEEFNNIKNQLNNNRLIDVSHLINKVGD